MPLSIWLMESEFLSDGRVSRTATYDILVAILRASAPSVLERCKTKQRKRYQKTMMQRSQFSFAEPPLLLGHDPDIRPLLQPLNLHADARHPAIALRAAARLEDRGAAGRAQARNPREVGVRTGPAALVASALDARAEQRLALAAPQHEARARVLVGRGPAVVEPDAGQRVVARVVAVEGLIAVEQVVFDGLDRGQGQHGGNLGWLEHDWEWQKGAGRTRPL